MGGFSIGLILLAFFLSGKKTSCDYGPNARTIKNISIKKRVFSETAEDQMTYHNVDTLTISSIIKSGSVNFSKSDTKADSCKTYLIENELNDKDVELWVKNCDSLVTIQSLSIK